MRLTLRLLLAAAAIGAPLFLAAPASANGPAPSTPYEEVAAARDRTAQARTTRRARREAAAQRRQRNTARQAARRARTASRPG